MRVDHATASPTKTWIEREFVGSEFTDVRLNKQLSDGTGESMPLVCQDWANTKAAYRFLSDASPTLAFTALEIRLRDQLAKLEDKQRPQTKSISTYLIRIARLGGYLARRRCRRRKRGHLERPVPLD